MSAKKSLWLFFSFAFLFLVLPGSAQAQDYLGNWISIDGDVKIRFWDQYNETRILVGINTDRNSVGQLCWEGASPCEIGFGGHIGNRKPGVFTFFGSRSDGSQIDSEFAPRGDSLTWLSTIRYKSGGSMLVQVNFVRAKIASPVQPVAPVQPVEISNVPNCLEMGYERGIIPQAMAAETLWCTKYVYNLSQRKDLKDCWNGSYPDAYLWDDWAREKDGRSRGCNLTVSPKDKNQPLYVNEVKAGDVAVWEPWCNGAKELGHVAYVTAVHRESGTVDVDEANWPKGSGEGHRNGVKIEQCMSFIHQKSIEQSHVGSEPSLWDRFLQLIRSCFGFCR